MLPGIVDGDFVPQLTGARAIQLALAPVFLLSGIAGMLNVMAGRLGRIIDRIRYLKDTPNIERPPAAHRVIELRALNRRRRLARSAITACAISALLICVVIVLLFAESVFDLPFIWVEGGLFSLATTGLVIGLGYFVCEVHVANRTMDAVDPGELSDEGPP